MPARLILLCLMLLPSLTGCGWLFGDEGFLRNKEDDYRDARATPRMQIPDGLDAAALQDLYVVPPGESSTLLVGDFEVPRPEPLHGAEALAQVRIQKLGDDQWILMESSPSEVWPQVRSFLLSNRLGLENDDVSVGIMESAWLTSEDAPEQREKYRYRVEQGIQRRSSEIYVMQVQLPASAEVLPEVPEWPRVSADLERENWMVGELANWLAATGESGSVSLLAQGLSTASKMYLVRDPAGRPVIDLRLPYDRAWASLGRALQKGEFNVVDLDREGGHYYVRYEPGSNEDDDGFFSRMFSWGDEEPGTGIPYVIDISEVDTGVLIGIGREDGTALGDEETDHLLGVIRGNLS